MRVYQIARSLEKPHRVLLQLLRELGHNVPSHMAPLEDDQEEQLREAIERQARGAPAVRPVATSGASISASQVAAVVGAVDLEEAETEEQGPIGPPAPPAGEAKEKRKPRRRGGLDRDALDEEYAREAELEGLAMVQEQVVKPDEEDDFIGPPLPPDGVVAEVVRTVDLSNLHGVIEPKSTPASRSRSRREARQNQQGGRNRPRTLQRRKRSGPKVSIQATQTIEVTVPIRMKDLSQSFGVRAQDMMRALMREKGEFVRINDVLDELEVEFLAERFERTVEIKTEQDIESKLEEMLLEQAIQVEGDEEPRPPIVAVLGHVDHGKTSLLDRIRNTNVAEGEAGGITQHIGAFQVELEDKSTITFLDTPGHAAFSAMRARGAKVADIVVLVVACDDGVMPQTAEAIEHAQSSNTPIVVAINKMDKPGANSLKVKQQLSAHGLTPEDWGGDVVMCEVSALTGAGMDNLLEMVGLTAEVAELKAVPKGPSRGHVVEARKDPHRGIVCTLLIDEGSLKQGDSLIAGMAIGRVRMMQDSRGKKVKKATPGMPVQVFGLSDVPNAGDAFAVVKNQKVAKQVVEERRVRLRELKTPERRSVTLANLFDVAADMSTPEVRIIVKADVRGSLEPITDEAENLNHEEVKLNVLYSDIGTITRSDIDKAVASDAVIIGFNVSTEPQAKKLAERNNVEIVDFKVIYEMVDFLRERMEELLAPELREAVVGHAEVRAVFASSRFGTIAGCMITDGVAKRSSYARVTRGGKVIFGGGMNAPVESLRRIKDDVREVKEGFECGVRVAGFDSPRIGDEFEFYDVREIKRTLDGGTVEDAAT